MKPITRKELYLNKIVGNNDYEIPEKPITTEEFFFAEILGEAVQAPEPLTRYQMYLAKIAGREIEIPYPEVRLEYFLARACGMDIETPTPITREEIFWSNYSAIVDFEVEGTPPLTYKAVAGTLKDYRIYGNTVDGNSVGDRTGNLFDEAIYNKNVGDNTLIYVPIYVGNIDYVTCSTTCPKTITSEFDSNNSRYIFILSGSVNTGAQNGANGVSNGAPRTIRPSNGYVTIAYRKIESSGVRPWEYQTMLNEGSTPLPYEPYGYKVAVTVEGKNILPMSTTPISTDVDDFHCEYDGMGTITLTATKDNANFSSFTIPLKEDFIIPISVGQGGNGCLQFNNDKAYFNDNTPVFSLCFNFNNTQIDSWNLLKVNRITYSYIGMGGRTINNISIKKEEQAVLHLSKGDKLTIQPAFYNNGTTEQVPFEPYHAPVTTPIYLPEPIKMVGDEAEHIEYGTQKMYRIGADDLDVTLPALPTLPGTNVLSVETEVQPSHIFAEFDKEREYG